jgi:rhodanese-related sulfurtransferase/uncharacterized membrane protein YedE/YeeE
MLLRISSENFGFTKNTEIMGPLIPQGFVNPDLSLFFAFVIGLGFGYVLEQGGFSNSRKLAGVFYGYDFVVLRVFFTAATTAALGLLLFQYLGWIDYDLLYINPTFLWSIILGGVIMGVGFILGGFCPGTSIVAAVIGKIDAMVFVVGMMIGIFFFGSFYEVFEPIYTGYSFGGTFVYDSLGMSRDFFMFMLVAIALTAFIVTRKIEDKVNSIQSTPGLFHPSYNGPFALMLAMALLVLFLPETPKAKWFEEDAKEILTKAASEKHYAEINEVAWKLLNPKANDLLLIDVREKDAFAKFSLPGAVNIPLSDILMAQYKSLLFDADKAVVFYSFSSTNADQAWMLTSRNGLKNARVLKGGLNGFFEEIFAKEHTTDSKNEMQQFDARFRERAMEAFKTGQAAEKVATKGTPVKTIVEIEAPPAGKGGC